MLLGRTASTAGAVLGAAMLIGLWEGTRFLPNNYCWAVDDLPSGGADALVAAVGILPKQPNVLPSFCFIVIGLTRSR